MNTNLCAVELRRWAEQCIRQSKDGLITGEQYEARRRLRNLSPQVRFGVSAAVLIEAP